MWLCSLPGTARDLPEELALPLASGAEWWYWLGGRPAIDLVNTLRERWRRRVETLVTPDDLGLWLVRAELLPAGAGGVARPPARGARAARGDRRLPAGGAGATSPRRPPRWRPSTAGSRTPSRARGSRWPATARPSSASASRPTRCAARWARSRSTRRACSAARPRRARIRVCASETCSARFYDRSPAGRRRWCSMALCGNEAKARRHRERARSAAA